MRKKKLEVEIREKIFFFGQQISLLLKDFLCAVLFNTIT